MKALVSLLLLLTAASLGAQPLDWAKVPPAQAEAAARSSARPVLLLWLAGPGAAVFTQGVERLFAPWPEWSALAASAAVFTRGRGWEAPPPPGFPPLPEEGRVSCLMLWVPGSPLQPSVWTRVPPVLELAARLASVSGLALAPPYQLEVSGYAWDQWSLTRVDQGPLWHAEGPEGPSEWVEEGPVGTVLVLTQPSTGRRAAFPLEGEWSFLYDPEDQSWAAWNPVLVKRP